MSLGTALRHFLLWLYQKKHFIVSKAQILTNIAKVTSRVVLIIKHTKQSLIHTLHPAFCHLVWEQGNAKHTEDLGCMKPRELKAEL